MKKLFGLLAVAALAACNPTSSTGPVPATEAKSAKNIPVPNHVSTSRYILISGVWTCVEECGKEPQ